MAKNYIYLEKKIKPLFLINSKVDKFNLYLNSIWMAASEKYLNVLFILSHNILNIECTEQRGLGIKISTNVTLPKIMSYSEFCFMIHHF